MFTGCQDFQCRHVLLGGDGSEVWVCWIDGLVSGTGVSEQVLRPLTDRTRMGGLKAADVPTALEGAIYASSLQRDTTMDDAVDHILDACCAVLWEGSAYCFQLRSDSHRSISAPTVEKTVKGGKDAFIEPLRANTALVRAKLRTPKLKVQQTVVGRKSRTKCAILWVEGVCKPELPNMILERLDSLETDGIIDAAELEAALSDAPASPFPQLQHTERTDYFVTELLEGRAGVLCDGLPLAFIVPGSFSELLKTSEDSARHFIIATALRLLRWVSLFLSVLLPSLLVAVEMYHQEMVPTKLLLSMIEAKQAVPFSEVTEILTILIAFELLQEAGLQLPDPMGQVTSIIGAVIVGQSAVEAKVISPIVVIVVALAGVAGYTIPSQDLSFALRLCRFGMVLLTLFAGMFGLMIGTVFILWHLCSLESYGVSYMSPLSSSRRDAFVQAILSKPPWKNQLRDPELNGGDLRRRK